MDVKYQIFVSSTFEDLKDERRAVMEAILNLRHIPVGMELFHATDESQWEYITRRIAECDYYVVIVAERYGSEVNGKSYTRKEYELAVELGIPVIGLLLDGSSRKTWPQDRVEFEKRDKVEELRSLCGQKLVKFWKNTDDLALKVTQALTGVMADHPRVGWVRGDNVPSVRVMEEIAALSEEKRKLQTRVDELSVREGELKIPEDVLWRLINLKNTYAAYYENRVLKTTSVVLLDVFLHIYKSLSLGMGEFSVAMSITDYLQVDQSANVHVSGIIAEFSTMNLVEVKHIQVTRFNELKTDKHLLLTEYGKNFAVYATSWLRSEAEPQETS